MCTLRCIGFAFSICPRICINVHAPVARLWRRALLASAETSFKRNGVCFAHFISSKNLFFFCCCADTRNNYFSFERVEHWATRISRWMENKLKPIPSSTVPAVKWSKKLKRVGFRAIEIVARLRNGSRSSLHNLHAHESTSSFSLPTFFSLVRNVLRSFRFSLRSQAKYSNSIQ